MVLRRIAWALLLVVTPSLSTADDRVVVFRGALVLPIAGPPIEDGVVIVRGASIEAIGRSRDLPTPAGAEVRDVRGRVLMPGLVDTHSHLGEVSGGDSSSALHPEVRALDGVDVHDDGFWRARTGGLTTINVMPGSSHLMSGQTVYLKLRRDPRTIEDWLLCTDPEHKICGSMKMANGTNSMRDKPFPGTRAKSAAMVRELFVKAQDWAEKRAKVGADSAGDDEADAETKRPDRDLGLEAVAEVLQGRRRVQFHTHRHDDIATILRLREEFGFTLVLQHGTESWMLAEELAREGIGVSFTFIDSPGGKEEILRMRMDAPALLDRAGVEVSLNTDDGITDSRLLFRTAAMAVRAGLSREAALRAVTLVPARQLGLADRIGSLERGKDADLVVLSGDPFAVDTQVLETWVEGQRVYDASDPEQRQYAVGGWRVFRGDAGHGHEGCGP